MIIMLNGTFGVGKTTTAEALLARIPNAHLFDPEVVGHFVRYLTIDLRQEDEETDDFQDIRIWPSLTVTAAQQLYQSYKRPLVVPMTLVHHRVLKPIREGFKAIAPVYHFCLVASLSTIQQRLQDRGDGPGSWTWRKADQYVPQLTESYYGIHLDTEHHTTIELVDQIMAHIA